MCASRMALDVADRVFHVSVIDPTAKTNGAAGCEGLRDKILFRSESIAAGGQLSMRSNK